MKIARQGQEGITVVAVLIYLAVAVALYLAYLYAPMWWRYYQVREAVGHTANIALHERDDSFNRFKCAEFLRKGPGFTVRPEACDVIRSRDGSKVSVSFTYTETISFFPTDKEENYTRTVTIESDNR